ncbi:uncharacterized protein LOC126876643 [Bombus huntii]|uniref:uncharacterized protein LOC126876643 n=1 Tax=Bombus huntii TaxID=85661 RepID=UPI0021A9AAB9|nr:uncharacterized protein LOC126876643 [Bombus huntii]
MSDEPTYKLIYFNARGSAEHIRYIFAYIGIEYTDERIPLQLWPEYKDCKREESIFTFIVQLSDIYHLLKLFCFRFIYSQERNGLGSCVVISYRSFPSTQCSYEPCLFLAMPYKKLPVLEVDGKPVAQADAVARYLARKYDLMGRNERDALICDVLVDTLEDLEQAICYCRMEEDPERKEARMNQLLNETIPLYLTKFDQIIGKYEGYIIPSTTTWADFVFAETLENFEYMFGAPVLDKYPALQALKKRIHTIPAISDWLISYGIGRTNPFFFSYASIPFEDERIKKDVWPEIKPYNALIDATVDTIHDIRHKIAAFHYEEDEKVKAAKRKAAEETLPFILERLDQQVKENDGYFYDGTLSWADLTFVALLDYLNFMYKSDLIENYENLKLLEKKVLLLPKIKNWIERRPVSEF